MDELKRRLADEGIESRPLHTSHAFHSGLMEGAVRPFVEAVRGVDLRAPQIPYLSNVTGDWVTAAQVTDPSYWGRHIREPVRFAKGAAALLSEPDGLFLEVGPGHTLSSLLRQQTKGHRLVLGSLRHPHEEGSDVAFILNTLGRLWIGGATVDWSGFYADERRLRVSLPSYPFERSRHWVEPDKPNLSRLRRMARTTEQDDLSDWFFAPSWKRSSALQPMQRSPEGDAADGFWLVFEDDAGLGARVASRLEESGRRVVSVAAGVSFSRQGPQRYVVNPSSRGDYQALIKALRASDGFPAAIAHLWGVTTETAPRTDNDVARMYQERGFYSLLYLAQALGESGVTAQVSLNVVTRGVHDVTGEETVVPETATALGPCRVIPLEFPNVSCRNVDIDLEPVGSPNDVGVEALVTELLTASQGPVVAHRRGRRWVQTYEPVRFEPVSAGQATRLREGGTYLITGGLGGIGLVLAEHLAKSTKGNLILTGRSALPDRDQWATYVERHGKDDGTSRKLLAVQALEDAGSEVMVAKADVCDAGQMRGVIDEALRRFGRIDGVIHSAGIAGGGMIQLKEPKVAEAVLRPKVDGTRVLADLFQETPLDFMVLCSSLTAILGGVGQVDYCGANAYLDAFARHYQAATGTFTVSINWSAWREVGMAVETDVPENLRWSLKEQMLASGLSNTEGVDAFCRILALSTDQQIAVSTLDVQALLEYMGESEESDETGEGRGRDGSRFRYGADERQTQPAVHICGAGDRGRAEDLLCLARHDRHRPRRDQ